MPNGSSASREAGWPGLAEPGWHMGWSDRRKHRPGDGTGLHQWRGALSWLFFQDPERTRRGSAAREMDFVVKGAMIGGFALVAAPAEYDVTGVRTFMVSQDGVVYENDLGPETLDAFKKMERFNPDASWTPVSKERETRLTFGANGRASLNTPKKRVADTGAAVGAVTGLCVAGASKRKLVRRPNNAAGTDIVEGADAERLSPESSTTSWDCPSE